jgi:hypothetical protein
MGGVRQRRVQSDARRGSSPESRSTTPFRQFHFIRQTIAHIHQSNPRTRR